MSLQITFEDFEKMIDKECLKRTGLSLKDFPTIWAEDFWPDPSLDVINIHDAKEAMEACLESAIDTL